MERLDGSVRRALRRVGVPDAGLLAEVTEAWPAAVGAPIARAAWPQRIARDGTLHVTVVSATWAFELGHLEADLRERLRAHLGDRTPPALRFAPGPVPAPGGVERTVVPLPPASQEEDAEALRLSAPIGDSDLREAVRRAVAASLVAARPDRGL